MGYLVDCRYVRFVIRAAKFGAAERALKKYVAAAPDEVHDAARVKAAKGLVDTLAAADFRAQLAGDDIAELSYAADKVPAEASMQWPDGLMAVLAKYSVTRGQALFWLEEDPWITRRYEVDVGGRLRRYEAIEQGFEIVLDRPPVLKYRPGLAFTVNLTITKAAESTLSKSVTLESFDYGEKRVKLQLAATKMQIGATQTLKVQFDDSRSTEQFGVEVEAFRKQQLEKFGRKRLDAYPPHATSYAFRLTVTQDVPDDVLARGFGAPQRMTDLSFYVTY